MAYEQKPGDISVFQEIDKRNERAPDWKGTMMVPEGVNPGDKLEVALWAKGTRGTMLAGSVKPPRERDDSFSSRRDGGVAGSRSDGNRQDAGRGGSGSSRDYDLNDDVPF